MQNNPSKKEELFHQVIHDLKSPLAAILGLAEIFIRVLSPNLNENQKDVIRKIKTHTQFALELVEDLLEIENLNTGTLKINKEQISLKQIVESSVQGHQIRAEEKNIELSCTVHRDIILLADERRIKQVLNNLISNSLKFSHADTTVRVMTDDNNGKAYIKIIDQGVGIKPEEMEKLFQPFAQISSQPTADEKSTGLGLSIVKKIIDLHDGHIYVESEDGQGSCFTIELPITEPVTA